MSNLEILKRVKKIYDPQTAFGNKELIKLLDQFQLPNENGQFEVTAQTEEVTTIRGEWECFECGYWNELDEMDEDDLGEIIDDTCNKCQQKHKVTIE